MNSKKTIINSFSIQIDFVYGVCEVDEQIIKFLIIIIYLENNSNLHVNVFKILNFFFFLKYFFLIVLHQNLLHLHLSQESIIKSNSQPNTAEEKNRTDINKIYKLFFFFHKFKHTQNIISNTNGT